MLNWMKFTVAPMALLFVVFTVYAQQAPLDPTRNVRQPVLESATHTPLPEEFIWTASPGPVDRKVSYDKPQLTEQTEAHYFRSSFNVQRLPKDATLYVAGPRWVKVYVNGRLADEESEDLSSTLGMKVFTADVGGLLRVGSNVVAIEAVRGRGIMGFGNSTIMRPQILGQLLVVKIVPAKVGLVSAPLVLSDAHWKSTAEKRDGWERAEFSDAAWPAVRSFGGIESDAEMFQWNADAGLYDWPGYDGISPYLAHLKLPASAVLRSFEGRSRLVNVGALRGEAGEFGVTVKGVRGDEDAPSVVLDFGRVVTGRMEIESDSDVSAQIAMQQGESEDEAMKEPYLGSTLLTVAPHAVAHGPKTSFRYVRLRFTGGGPELRFKSIHADHIYYPVTYAGSFESSDATLNRMWEVGAYTAHLCMQDGLWDAPKRDRGRWAGDNDVSQRVINDVFADHAMLEETMDKLIGNAPVTQHVNGIPGYSSFWLTAMVEYYRHTRSAQFSSSMHDRVVQLLRFIDSEFDERGLYTNKNHVWLYVDWSPELNGDTEEARRATQFEFYRAYREAAWMLRDMGDVKNADLYEQRAATIRTAAEKYLLDPATGTYGTRWQVNAMAVLSGIAGPERYDAIWTQVLSKVGHTYYSGLIVTPYYNYYVIAAMAKMGHRQEALEWMRTYWGGMLAEGATTFWEGYDPDWYKGEAHASLQADNLTGYRISLTHGWSAGPTAWLMEEMLGIRATGAGFDTVAIRPELMGVSWARGAEPTPHGSLRVEARGDEVVVDLPEGIAASVSVAVRQAGDALRVNGKVAASESVEQGARRVVVLRHGGHYVLQAGAR